MPKRILKGPVVSATGDKTVVVRIDRAFQHPLLKKIVRRSKKYHAHDEANAHKVGDTVQIRECPPKSKLKRWEVVTEEQIAADASAAGE
ncbi:MAG: 30S ribosomal protein S17 [Ruegeria sp.]